MAEHAKKSPSAAHRWMACAGCLRLCGDLPRTPSSIYALEGTAAHYLGEKCLRDGEMADHMKGKKITVECDVTKKLERFTVDDEMIDAVQKYLDVIAVEMVARPNAVLEVEKKLDASWVSPDLWGTGDAVIVDMFTSIDIIDYKHGRGVPVDVINNPQLKIYALGALGPDNINMVSTINCTIVQPRSFHPDGPVRTVTYSVDELYEWAEKVLKPAADLTMRADSPLKSGEWCRWCDAKDPNTDVGWAGCPEIERQAYETAVQAFGSTNPAEMQIVDPGTLTAQELDKRLALIGVIEMWAEGIKSEAFKRLTNGHPHKPTTLKIVEGKSNRIWEDEKAVEDRVKAFKLKDMAYSEPKLKTPTQLLSALKKAKLDGEQLIGDLIVKPKGKPTMVPIDDPRPPMAPALEEVFGEPEKPLF